MSMLPGVDIDLGIGRCPAISLIGSKANRILSAPGFSGEVISAGSRAVYIETVDGEILAACRPDQHPHPRSFLTDFDLAGLEIGLSVWLEASELRFGNGACVGLSESQVWNPRLLLQDSTSLSLAVLRTRWDALTQASIAFHQGDNLGLAVPLLTNKFDALEMNCTSPLVAAGLTQVEKLIPHCRRGDLSGTLMMAENLIGLGHGLTPSGDDFVGGLVFMYRQIEAAYPTSGLWEGGDVPALLKSSKRMTSRISHTLLADLVEGQSHAPLHDLANDLFSDSRTFAAEDHVRSVSSIGHSSGWDMLTGMLAGLLPVTNRDED
ncbi:MAG: DUF2877 domain-containing protein [Dehalococcoidia bacterium]|nr:DUF2877 domain-containing protein [Dehalococcoidia bacterium]